MSAIAFAGNASTPPVSVCSEDCLDGEAKQYFASDKCCWSCLRCMNYYVSNFFLSFFIGTLFNVFFCLLFIKPPFNIFITKTPIFRSSTPTPATVQSVP
jgi:hypothetical protein